MSNLFDEHATNDDDEQQLSSVWSISVGVSWIELKKHHVTEQKQKADVLNLNRSIGFSLCSARVAISRD